MKELSAVVHAEAASNVSEFCLLQDMNQVVQQKYAGMLSQVNALHPHVQVTMLLLTFTKQSQKDIHV